MSEYVAENFIYSEEFAKRVANAYKTLPANELIDTGLLKLWKDPEFSPSPQTEEAAFDAVECDFEDYAAAALTLTAGVNLSGSIAGCVADSTFTITTDPVVTSNTVYGGWVSSLDGLVGYFKFPEGQEVPMAEVGDWLHILLKLPVMFYQDVS